MLASILVLVPSPRNFVVWSEGHKGGDALDRGDGAVVVFDLCFTVDCGAGAGGCRRRGRRGSFRFLVPLSILYFVLTGVSPGSSVPTITNPSNLLVSKGG